MNATLWRHDPLIARSAYQDLAGRHAPKPPVALVVARRLPGREMEIAGAGPVKPDAVFELGSVTKAVTDLLLADAVVRGEVTLATTLDECLPGARDLELARWRPIHRDCPGFRWRSCDAACADGTTRTRARRSPSSSRIWAAFGCGRRAVRATRTSARCSSAGRWPPARGPCTRTSCTSASLRRWESRRSGRDAPAVAQPHDRRGRPVRAWTLDAYSPGSCLRGTVRGLRSLSLACLHPPPEMAAAVAVALTPSTRGRMVQFRLSWMRSPAHRRASMWCHNGGTAGSRCGPGSPEIVAKRARG